MKFSHPKMKDEHFKAIFEESGNSMIPVSNENDSTCSQSFICNSDKRISITNNLKKSLKDRAGMHDTIPIISVRDK